MATKTWDAASERFTETDAGRIDRLRRLRRIHGVARMMDTAIGIPGTRFRFGADSIMGLVPLVGDAGGALIGLYIVNEARRMGVPNDKLAKMIGNLAVDLSSAACRWPVICSTSSSSRTAATSTSFSTISV